jgi:hypothetical protein
MVNDYKVNGKRSLDDLEMRLELHVLPVFGSRRASSITTADINRFVLARQLKKASNGQINRELTAIKRALSLGKHCQRNDLTDACSAAWIWL